LDVPCSLICNIINALIKYGAGTIIKIKNRDQQGPLP